ncbi:hypothetical protein GN244_ATG17600 [Phytophthora infestans]|uniref:Uncharacterized protein n=1 Tax=Phytophthora infestans TaxID=4787 RepID=A0A833W5D5_PHYIN|nr:hypothetical protein GN244_ATG17600 [Phytophthora infestans]
MLVAELNTMHKRKLRKDQYKSKFARLMHDYDLYKHIRSLSGAGIESDTTPTLDDDVWERLMASKPQAKSKIKEIKKAGFVHAAVWCLIAGDTRANGKDARTVPELVVELDAADAQDAGESPGESPGRASTPK